ncbi:hypothetical protein WMF30_02715 [Sorangium sp. So ce134]
MKIQLLTSSRSACGAGRLMRGVVACAALESAGCSGFSTGPAPPAPPQPTARPAASATALAPAASTAAPLLPRTPERRISISHDRGCAVLVDKTVACWGGPRGSVPRLVPGIADAVDVVAVQEETAIRASCAAARPARGVWYARSVRLARYPRSAAAILRSVPQSDRALLLRLGLDLDNPAHAELFVEGVRAADDAIADQVRWERERLG